MQQGRVLVVAGSDSGGGAGIQADLKALMALGAYGTTAITALTAQNTREVRGILPVEPAFIVQQMETVLDDIGTDAVKTGMLHSAAVIDAVADVLEARCADLPLVVDPVMVSASGHDLLEPDAVQTLTRRLPILASLMTPNVPEATKLTGMPIEDLESMVHAAEMLRTMGPKGVLLKGGHLDLGETVRDVLVTDAGTEILESPKVNTRSTHGTGCTLASAIAASLAYGLDVVEAVKRARAYLYVALRTAPGLGKGNGPLNHGHTVRNFMP
jgi:hydroxymethylpyrimidine/phosphomethylpyrimidine kinase